MNQDNKLTIKQWLHENAVDAHKHGCLKLQVQRGVAKPIPVDQLGYEPFHSLLDNVSWIMVPGVQGHLWWRKPIITVRFKYNK